MPIAKATWYAKQTQISVVSTTTKWHEWWNVSIRRFCIPEQSQFCEFELVEIGNIPYFLPVGTKKLQNWGNFGRSWSPVSPT